jgi:hypothetical protein
MKEKWNREENPKGGVNNFEKGRNEELVEDWKCSWSN